MGGGKGEFACEPYFFAGDFIGNPGSKPDEFNEIFFVPIGDVRGEYFFYFMRGKVIAGLDVFNFEMFCGANHHAVGVVFNVNF
jgi:hypothetical protein